MQAIPNNVEDKSNEQGFQFIFKCETCGAGFESQFVPSKSSKEKQAFNKISQFGGMFSSHAYMAGAMGGQAYQTPEWNKEREAALKKATDESMTKLHQCPKCHKFVCDNDWSKDASMCSVDAAQLQATSAQKTQPEAPAICPKCGQPSGAGKFCNNCGAPLGPSKCAACGTENSPGAKFCGGCGAKL
jgi:hypothetical protein